jgi:hypothetical protein
MHIFFAAAQPAKTAAEIGLGCANRRWQARLGCNLAQQDKRTVNAFCGFKSMEKITFELAH